MTASAAHAAVTVPRSAEADTVRRQAEQSAPITTPAPSVEGIPTAIISIPEGAEKIKFVLHGVAVEGSTVYTGSQLADSYRKLLGKKISLADVYVISAQITQRYLNDGYLLSKAYVPQQQIEGGRVRIRVIEGYIGHIRWTGDPLNSVIAKQMANRLLNARPLKGALLEDVTLRLNELAGVEAKGTLAPAADKTEGAVDVIFSVTRKRVTAQLDLNDYTSRYLGTWQSSAQVSLAGLLSPVDQLAFNLTSSINPALSRYGRVEYSVPVNAGGTLLKAGGSLSFSAPSYRLEVLDVRSKATSEWVGVSQPVLRSRAQNLTVSGQFNVNDQFTDILHTPFYVDRLRTLQATVLYNLADQWSGINIVEADLYKGLNVMNSTGTGTDMLSRSDGHSDFIKMTFNASRLQTLNPYLSLLLTATGQMSNDPLLSSEQFGFGGSSFGRAYDSSEISGDQGIAGALELRYNNLALFQDAAIQPYAFYDIGRVYSKSPGVNPLSAASAGFGFRTQDWGFLRSDLFIAWPLTYTPATPKLGQSDRQPRFGVSLTMTY